LETALAFEAILGKPLREIFGGVYSEISVRVRERARELLRESSEAVREPRRGRRKQSLERIAS
jgi:hypothetical protein